ncbi:MAG: metal-dependent transcriptional regulator, partial [Coprococcus comes]|nr:metal-dependent transcriptional regulator [Coprococcus comes]
ARGELEEDLLEYVYRKWRQGRQITSKEYARTTGITTSEVLFLYKKYPVNSVLESKKTVAEGL